MEGQETKKMKGLPQKSKIFFLVGGWTTQLKIISQLGNLPQVGVRIKNIWNHQPVLGLLCNFILNEHFSNDQKD